MVHSPAVADSDSSFYEFEVVRGRFQAVVDEAAAVLMRTAFSNIVRESKDFACAVLQPNGHTVVQSQQSIPLFMGSMTNTWRGMSLTPAAEGLQDGDVLATNDPWLGTGHLNDITLIAPVFHEGEMVALTGVVAHVSDIGGSGHLGQGSQMFEEGIRLPVLKLVDQGKINTLVLDILSANVRLPDEVLGDVNAMLNATAVINRQVRGLFYELGTSHVHYVAESLEERTEEYLRSVISRIPDGTYGAELSTDGGTTAPFEIKLKVLVSGDEMVLDFEGTSPQVEEGINSTRSFSYAYSLYACKCLLAPDLPLNEGIFRPIQFQAPPGCIVNSKFPAAGSGRSTVGHFLPTIIYRALAEILPERIIAECGAPRATVTMRGVVGEDEGPFSARFSCAGGFGARAHKDGLSALSFPTNTQPIPIELLEANNPLIFDEAELIPDSGGAGQFRGGLGQRMSLRVLADHCSAFVRVQWVSEAPRGVAGGSNGGKAAVVLNGEDVGKPGAPVQLTTGDVFTVQSPGSGGYGDPHKRDPERVKQDMKDGYISSAEAQRYHGYTG